MKPPEPIHLSDRQSAVHDILTLHSSSLGRMYIGALFALSDESNPECYPQAAHSLRELMEKLPRVDLPAVERMEARVDELEVKFTAVSQSHRLAGDREVQATEELAEFLTDLEAFFREFHEERPKRIDRAVQVIRRLDPSSQLLPASIERRLALAWHGAHGYFEKLSHHNGSELGTSKEAFARRVDAVETILLALLRPRPAEDYEKLDAAIHEGEDGAVTSDLMARITPLLLRGDAARYFYSHLSSPVWIPALAEADLLEPPASLRRDGGIAFPTSSVTQYLARIASKDPGAVVAAFTHIRTDNCRAHEDCADAALAMPASHAVRLVPQLEKWLGSPYQQLLLWKAGAVVSHLAKGGEASAALKLARRALSLDTGLGQRDSNDYQDVLQDNVPDLVEAVGVDALELLCSLLDQAIRHKVAGAVGPEDHSQYWRPSMEDRDGDVNHGLRYGLSGAVRDAGLALAAQSAVSLSEVLESLEKWQWFFFRRLALHVLRLTEGALLGVIGSHLLDRKLFDSPQLRPEYQLLLREHFGRLSDGDQERLLDWMTEDPKPAASDEHAERRAQIRLYSWLSLIEPHLRENLREHYRVLRQQFGELPAPGAFPSPVAVFSGPTSPYSLNELLDLCVDEVVKRLGAWQPTGEWGEPSREGLGRVLTSAVEQMPGAYSRLANDFKILHKTYPRALLQGCEAAVRKGAAISWPEVIELCVWLVFEAERDDGDAADTLADDPGLQWTRQEVASLLQAGLSSDLPDLTLREPVWRVLQALCGDPDPAQAEHSESGLRWWDAAANSVRGVALLAGVSYGAWVKQRLIGGGEAWSGFDSVPELRAVLEERLDAAKEQSVAVHSVFGRVVTTLAALDRGWVEANADELFPPEKHQRKRWQAALDSYVVFCRPHEALLDLMKPQYRRAVGIVGGRERTASPGGLMSPDHHLVVHLMTFYWHGALDLAHGGLMSEFFAKVPVGYRRDALLFLGRGLQEESGLVGSDVQSRLRFLWERRVTELQGAKDKGELSAFGPWFASRLFDETWSLECLQGALRGAGSIDGAREVVKRLAVLLPTRPLPVLSCLSLLVKGQKQDHVVHVTRGQIAEIMEQVLAGSFEPEVLAPTAQLANHLLAMGYEEFRDVARRASPGG